MLKIKIVKNKKEMIYFSLTFSRSLSVVLKLRFFTNNVNVSSSFVGSCSCSSFSSTIDSV